MDPVNPTPGAPHRLVRRTFMALVSGGLLTAPLAAEAEPAMKVYRIGLLGGSPPTARDASGRLWEGFFQGLRELGYVEGQNILVEGRWYGEQPDRLPALAAELGRAKVDVIVAGAAPAPEAAQRATSTIPIVMASHVDPVGSGLVVSLKTAKTLGLTIPPSLLQRADEVIQ